MSLKLPLRIPRLKLVWDDDSSPAPMPVSDTDAPPDADAGAAPNPAKPIKPAKKLNRERARPMWLRLIAIGPGGFLNLVLWCVIAGLVMRFTGLSPWTGPQSAAETADSMWRQGLDALGWAVKMGWKPALTGATVILPVWLGWRVITLPFRR